MIETDINMIYPSAHTSIYLLAVSLPTRYYMTQYPPLADASPHNWDEEGNSSPSEWPGTPLHGFWWGAGDGRAMGEVCLEWADDLGISLKRALCGVRQRGERGFVFFLVFLFTLWFSTSLFYYSYFSLLYDYLLFYFISRISL